MRPGFVESQRLNTLLTCVTTLLRQPHYARRVVMSVDAHNALEKTSRRCRVGVDALCMEPLHVRPEYESGASGACSGDSLFAHRFCPAYVVPDMYACVGPLRRMALSLRDSKRHRDLSSVSHAVLVNRPEPHGHVPLTLTSAGIQHFMPGHPTPLHSVDPAGPTHA